MQSVLQQKMKRSKKRYLVWHNQQTVTLSDRPRLHFSHYNSAHIFVFINYWHSALSIKMLHLAYNQYNISTSYINIFSMKSGLELNGFNNNVKINYQSYTPVILSGKVSLSICKPRKRQSNIINFSHCLPSCSKLA